VYSVSERVLISSSVQLYSVCEHVLI